MNDSMTRIDERSEIVVQSGDMSVDQLVAHVGKIQGAMKRVMVVDVHYGVIPGTPKPTLYQPGAQVLCLMFRFAPEFSVQDEQDGNHRNYTSTCRLVHAPSGRTVGQGVGSCSTREKKYAWRTLDKVCPNCGMPTIIKGKADFGGGWVCWQKKGGCDSKFKEGDPAIEAQPNGRIENPDLPDTYNTCLKMANKRALVAAVIGATAASDIFTQDIEDFEDAARPGPAPKQDMTPKAKANGAPRSGNAAPPPQAAAPRTAKAGILGVESKVSTKGKPFYVVKFDDATEATTFSGSLAKKCEEAVGVLVDYVVENKHVGTAEYRNLVTVDVSADHNDIAF